MIRIVWQAVENRIQLLELRLPKNAVLAKPVPERRNGFRFQAAGAGGAFNAGFDLRMFNKLTFSIDESGAPEGVVIDIPDTSYTYIDPGLGLRFPITGSIAALGEARFLFVTKAGQIQQMMQYGTTTITGYDVDLGGEYKLSSSLLVRAGLRYTALSLKFDGSGELTDRNGDGTQDVTAAKDKYLGLYAAAGWLF